MSIEENLHDEKFMEATNAMIELANRLSTQLGEEGEHKMGVAFIYAAARYNAYLAAGSVTTAGELADRKVKAADFFSDRFRQLYLSNLEEYIEHFDELLAEPEEVEIEKAAMQ